MSSKIPTRSASEGVRFHVLAGASGWYHWTAVLNENPENPGKCAATRRRCEFGSCGSQSTREMALGGLKSPLPHPRCAEIFARAPTEWEKKTRGKRYGKLSASGEFHLTHARRIIYGRYCCLNPPVRPWRTLHGRQVCTARFTAAHFVLWFLARWPPLADQDANQRAFHAPGAVFNKSS